MANHPNHVDHSNRPNRPNRPNRSIFNLDGLVADTRGAYVDAWSALAAAKGLRPLSPHQVRAG
jgi:hypothetical protein